jgi:hypothetical protein
VADPCHEIDYGSFPTFPMNQEIWGYDSSLFMTFPNCMSPPGVEPWEVLEPGGAEVTRG